LDVELARALARHTNISLGWNALRGKSGCFQCLMVALLGRFFWGVLRRPNRVGIKFVLVPNLCGEIAVVCFSCCCHSLLPAHRGCPLPPRPHQLSSCTFPPAPLPCFLLHIAGASHSHCASRPLRRPLPLPPPPALPASPDRSSATAFPLRSSLWIRLLRCSAFHAAGPAPAPSTRPPLDPARQRWPSRAIIVPTHVFMCRCRHLRCRRPPPTHS
jgi:hypothetical protein